MSDWQVGDLAASVGCAGPCPYCDSGLEGPAGDVPSIGEVLEVKAIDTDPYWTGLCGLIGLAVGDYGFVVSCAFRKVVADKHEDCEPEFVTLLKRSKVKANA